MKRVLSVVMALAAMSLATLQAYADGVGVVDMNKIQTGYTKIRSLSEEAALKQLELQKMQIEANIQLRNTKASQPNNPVALEQQQKALTEKIQAKSQEIESWSTTQAKAVQASIDAAIDAVAKAKGLSAVVDSSKDANQSSIVLWGGTDITSEVLARLNK